MHGFEKKTVLAKQILKKHEAKATRLLRFPMQNELQFTHIKVGTNILISLISKFSLKFFQFAEPVITNSWDPHSKLIFDIHIKKLLLE